MEHGARWDKGSRGPNVLRSVSMCPNVQCYNIIGISSQKNKRFGLYCEISTLYLLRLFH